MDFDNDSREAEIQRLKYTGTRHAVTSEEKVKCIFRMAIHVHSKESELKQHNSIVY